MNEAQPYTGFEVASIGAKDDLEWDRIEATARALDEARQLVDRAAAVLGGGSVPGRWEQDVATFYEKYGSSRKA